MITLIAAIDKKYGIGLNNDIPWNEPEDLKNFFNETVGGAVIMGKNTFKSLAYKPLQNRLNIVVSSSLQGEPVREGETPPYYVVGSIREAMSLTHKHRISRVYGIGGHKIYKEMLAMADRIVLTRIKGVYNCDTFFPFIEYSKFKEVTMYSYDNFVITEYLRNK